ncbi:MAG: TatD family hydrolase [Gammaproteobacteria bacterium]|nr:TatD family hydrolase [Gammaproteobacteria bacterium]MBU1602344.1 TatD family hydrolase [Gammaproteobacteria bacterium]MBU2433150.1 TatD family hydrolase [Gammaproteobacteria bacterium]MBU2451065.1 TatD family hydrolase [Gammaproteobacteria bacterium]
MLIDTHCHLDAAEFDADRDAVYAAALAAGVERIVVPGVTVNRNFRPKSKIADYPACLEAYGIHPLYVDQSSPDDLSLLRGWLQQAPPIAVGEIGLDFYVSGIDSERQTDFFVEQLRLARDFDLPVLLHIRRAVDPVLKQLRRIGVRGGIAHAFNGSRQQADEFIKLGFALGFGGAMTFSGSTRIRELTRTLPLESIVLETDAPDIPPAWLNGGRNAPAELPRIAAVLADLRGLTVAEVSAASAANARRVLPGI